MAFLFISYLVSLRFYAAYPVGISCIEYQE